MAPKSSAKRAEIFGYATSTREKIMRYLAHCRQIGDNSASYIAPAPPLRPITGSPHRGG
ncbi:protein of unknown function [Serratia sp. Tan611]|nr:protein of unknown function [Serratia sp. Tan611]